MCAVGFIFLLVYVMLIAPRPGEVEGDHEQADASAAAVAQVVVGGKEGEEMEGEGRGGGDAASDGGWRIVTPVEIVDGEHRPGARCVCVCVRVHPCVRGGWLTGVLHPTAPEHTYMHTDTPTHSLPLARSLTYSLTYRCSHRGVDAP